MIKKVLFPVSVIVIAAMLLASCAPAATQAPPTSTTAPSSPTTAPVSPTSAPAATTAPTSAPAATAAATSAPAPSSGSPVTLQVWIYDSFTQPGAPIFAAVDQFQKDNPDIKIQLVPTTYGSTSYLNKYITAFQGGSGPDVLMSDVAWMPELAAMGALMQVDSQASSDIKNFYPGPVQTVTYNGHLYGLPFYTNDVGMFYNKTAFQNAGLTPPADGWTWADFIKDAKALTKGNMYGFGFEGGYGGTFEWYPWFWQNGGQLLNADGTSVAFNSPAGLEATKTFLGLTTTDKVVPPAAMTWKSWDELAAAFSSGVIAMFESGDYAIAPVKKANPSFQWGIAPLPMNKQKATVVGGADWAINANSKNAAAAYRWIQYITGPSVLNLMDGYDRLAARVGNTDQAIVKSDPNMQVLVSALQDSQARPSNPQWTNIDYNCLEPAFQKVLLQGADVTTAMNEAATCGNQKLAKK